MHRTARLTRYAWVASATLLGACAGGTVHTSARPAAACAAVPLTTTPIDSALVVVTSPVDLTNAPRATTFGETFVFGLTGAAPSIDCRGKALGAASYQARLAAPSTITLDP